MTNETRDMNRDPITGEPGSHPVGTGFGAAGGATAGAVIGSIFGPIGTLIGGAIGAVGGGAAGHTLAEGIDPTGEAEYWRTTYASRPYYDSRYDYETDYAPAYAYGNTIRGQYADRPWNDSLEADVRNGWEATKANSRSTKTTDARSRSATSMTIASKLISVRPSLVAGPVRRGAGLWAVGIM